MDSPTSENTCQQSIREVDQTRVWSASPVVWGAPRSGVASALETSSGLRGGWVYCLELEAPRWGRRYFWQCRTGVGFGPATGPTIKRPSAKFTRSVGRAIDNWPNTRVWSASPVFLMCTSVGLVLVSTVRLGVASALDISSCLRGPSSQAFTPLRRVGFIAWGASIKGIAYEDIFGNAGRVWATTLWPDPN